VYNESSTTGDFMSKHTPGPWMADNTHYSDCVVVVDSRGFQIVEATHMPILLNYGEKLGIPHWADKPGESFLELDPEEQSANARLIAAAPDLLKALEELSLYVSHNGDEWLRNKARDALAKVYGD